MGLPFCRLYAQKSEVLSPRKKKITSSLFCIINYYYNIQITRTFGLSSEADWNAGSKSEESVTESMLRKRVGLKEKNKIEIEVKVKHEGRKESDSEFETWNLPDLKS